MEHFILSRSGNALSLFLGWEGELIKKGAGYLYIREGGVGFLMFDIQFSGVGRGCNIRFPFYLDLFSGVSYYSQFSSKNEN